VPIVSIITPCYNGAEFVERTITSALHQTFQEWELVVVDDGSVDESVSLVEALQCCDSRVHLVRQDNGGVSKARNTGYATCDFGSRYLWFLDADDCLDPDALQAMTDYLDQHPEVGLVYCDYREIDGVGRPLTPPDTLQFVHTRWTRTPTGIAPIAANCPETPFASLLAWNTVFPSICLLRRSVYEQTQGWDEMFRHGYEDVDLILQMALLAEVHYFPHVFVSCRIHENNKTTQDRGRQREQRHRLTAKLMMGQGMTPAQRDTVRSALYFEMRILGPRLCLRRAWESLAQGSLLECGRHCFRAARHFFDYWAATHTA
jgi:glycosyltransferase involved in cell wall biosynthesis